MLQSTSLTDRSIVIIGPFKIGKSTIASKLRLALGWPLYEPDECHDCYFQQGGINANYPNGFCLWDQMLPEFQQYHAVAVERFMSKFSSVEENCIFGIGGTQSVYEDRVLLEQIQAVLEPYNVVLLLPSPDPEESVEFLSRRIKTVRKERAESWSDEQIEKVVRHGVYSKSNQQLAKIVVYTMNKNPQAICDEIYHHLSLSSANGGQYAGCFFED